MNKTKRINYSIYANFTTYKYENQKCLEVYILSQVDPMTINLLKYWYSHYATSATSPARDNVKRSGAVARV